TGRTNVDVALLVECEVLPTEGPILALRLVDHRDVRGYLRFVDQPVEVGSRTVARIASKPPGLDVKALLGAFDHSPGRAHFGLADGARRLDVHDDAGLHDAGVGAYSRHDRADGDQHFAELLLH